jgi:dolichol-phosphate mannosyltransferase
MASKKLISIVAPAYNEEACIEALHQRICAAMAEVPQYDFEIILVENGSRDNTFQVAARVHERDPRFKVIKLSRNFMPEGGIAAGLSYARGDAVVVMSADLEDPPELIPQFIRKWEEGYDNVYGVIEKRHASALRTFNSKMFYRVIHFLTGRLIPMDVADFRLVDRKVYEIINQMQERNRFLRGLFAWVGFKSIGVPFQRGYRHGGVSKASTRVVLNLAFRGIFSFSNTPLRISMGLGFVLSFLSFLGMIYFIGKILVFGWLPFNGFGTIVCLNLFLFGMVFIILGIMSEYIGMIFREVKKRPLFIVDKGLGVE